MLIYCCADLLFSTRIRAAAEDTGVGSRPARDAEALAKRLNRVDDGKLNEPVTGVMIDLDLGEAGLLLLKQVKAFDTNIPVVAFGAHVAVELLQAAREGGGGFCHAARDVRHAFAGFGEASGCRNESRIISAQPIFEGGFA